jgi:hypothetical protein
MESSNPIALVLAEGIQVMNILEVLEELGIDFRESGSHHHASPGWVQICCPFCGEDNFKRGISLNYGNTNCWSCGAAPLASVLCEASKESYSKIKALLQGVGWDRNLDEGYVKRGRLVLPLGIGELQEPHLKYLRGRGFDPDVLVRLWGIQGMGMDGEYPWSLFIPICYRGKMVSWTTRSLSKKGRRYITAKSTEEAYPAKDILFGWDYVRHAAILCEGPFDAMRIGPGAVACFGTSYTAEQIALFARVPIRIICFDTEDIAQEKAREILWTMAALPGETINVVLESGKDPGSADEEELKEIRRRYLE